ncbi:type I restriction endonuclease subunit R [Rickettsia endosymbiont of Halotydeus destructor]|uniref:type I restriction endonuclease subunit R n=1 Tax=Rickettsia endosymbiont of Halotydeus destructor TaxID=2996754 RepID=UPI003BAF2D80
MTSKPNEKVASQIPAMISLITFGYIPISQEEVQKKRGKLSNVLLEDILIEKTLEFNNFTYREKIYNFDIEDAKEAIRKLKLSSAPQNCLMEANQKIYDDLILGTSIEKTIDGTRKSFSFKYIDWDNTHNNIYHATVEMRVSCTDSSKTRRCDIVLFVNGIPLVMIENKKSDISIEQAISQQIRNQGAEEIPQLFHYAQLLLAVSTNEVKYGTVNTPKKHWQIWHDTEDKEEDIYKLINRPLTNEEKLVLFSGEFASEKTNFEKKQIQGFFKVTAQDRGLYALCRPERLLEIIHDFCIFDGRIKKLARYPQFFGVRAAMQRVNQLDETRRREGGVIWHTQGTGKSLTMVMLTKALIKNINNARIILVTDRTDLDNQLKNTFKSCEFKPVCAASGKDLIQLIKDKKTLITTVINKFNTTKFNIVMNSWNFKDEDNNIFVLVDEGHRTQAGLFAEEMRRILPKACYIGFTGTPLLKGEKTSTRKFGGFIHTYTIEEAVRDGVIVPLIYESRNVGQKLGSDVIDEWFERVVKGLSNDEKNILKSKFACASKLSQTKQTIYAKAVDISEHYRQTHQGTGLKAQLVAPSKAAAIRFKNFIDDIGHVTCEVIISPPDDREDNEEVDRTSKNFVQTFWKDMMNKYKTEAKYNNKIIEDFKEASDPEILIVVSKLLTGFDAPRNTVLYICKRLKEHTLLQAIARVNRLFEEENNNLKQHGYIIDYEGLLGNLHKTLNKYHALKNFDEEDLKGALYDIQKKLEEIPQLHQDIWDIFASVPNKSDTEQLQQHLADNFIRKDFYLKLQKFTSYMSIALVSEKAHKIFPEKLNMFCLDWHNFKELKKAVQNRYQDIFNTKEYEPKILNLLDDHIMASPAYTIIEKVNIHDPTQLAAIIAKQGISDLAKADLITAAMKNNIDEHQDAAPALYQKFSEILNEIIEKNRKKRLNEKDILKKALLDKDYLTELHGLAKEGPTGYFAQTFPAKIRDNPDAQAFYAELLPHMEEFHRNDQDIIATIALDTLDIIKPHLIVCWETNEEKSKTISKELYNYFLEVLKKKMLIPTPLTPLTPTEIDKIFDALMSICKKRFPGK